MTKERCETDAEIASIWRNGITNTVAVIDGVRARFAKTRWTGKTYAEFDEALDKALDEWFRATRQASPKSYEEAEAVWREYRERPQ